MRPPPRRNARTTREALEAALTSDLDEGAKVVWVYLYACKGGGMGTASLARVLQMPVGAVEGAIEILRERGVLVRKNGTWRAAPFQLDVDVVDDAETQAAQASPAQAAALAILSHYDNARIGAGLGPLMDQRSALAHFRPLAVWLHDYGVTFDRFLEWAVERCDFLKARGVAFPTPALLNGPWLRGEWLNRVDGKRRDPTRAVAGHAGRSYRDPVGLRSRLVEAGFTRAKGWSKDQLRHVLEWAENMVALPDHFDTAPAEFEVEVLWLRDRLAEGGDASAA